MGEIGCSGSNACSATRGDDYPTTGHGQRKAAEDKRHTVASRSTSVTSIHCTPGYGRDLTLVSAVLTTR